MDETVAESGAEGDFFQFADRLDRPQAHPNNALDQLQNILLIIAPALGIVDDAAALVGFDSILIDNPVQRRAIAKPIGKDAFRDVMQRQAAVDFQTAVNRIAGFGFALVFGQHPVDAVGYRLSGDLPVQFISFSSLIIKVQAGQGLAGLTEGAEIRREGDARQLPFEVGGIARTPAPMMQHAIDIIKDIPFADGRVVIAAAELLQCPVGDVFFAAAALFVIGVEREALKTVYRCYREIGDNIGNYGGIPTSTNTYARHTNNLVFSFGLFVGEERGLLIHDFA